MNHLNYFSFFIIILLISCNTNTVNKNNSSPVTKKKLKQLPITSNSNNVNISKTAFVIAKNGLNYRKAPKEKIIGKFPYGTKVKIIEQTGIKEEIKDDGRIIYGEWVGIKIEKDKIKSLSKVYVFDGFLGGKEKILTSNPIKYISQRSKTRTSSFNSITYKLIDTIPFKFKNKYLFGKFIGPKYDVPLSVESNYFWNDYFQIDSLFYFSFIELHNFYYTSLYGATIDKENFEIIDIYWLGSEGGDGYSYGNISGKWLDDRTLKVTRADFEGIESDSDSVTVHYDTIWSSIHINNKGKFNTKIIDSVRVSKIENNK